MEFLSQGSVVFEYCLRNIETIEENHRDCAFWYRFPISIESEQFNVTYENTLWVSSDYLLLDNGKADCQLYGNYILQQINAQYFITGEKK